MMTGSIQTNNIFIAMDLVRLTSSEPLSASNLVAPSTTFNLGGVHFHFFSGVVHGAPPSFAIPLCNPLPNNGQTSKSET